MNWFQQNKFLGIFLALLGVATLGALYFIWSAKSGFDDAKERFDQNAAELNRLQALTPFPSEVNLKKMKTQADDYATELNKLKEDLKTRVLPMVPMAPNEFQARLRQAITSLNEKAKANKVKLPENFFLGFEEFSATLPDTAAAPLLGQQLAQAEMLVGILIDARVDAVTVFRRVPSTEQASVAPATSSPTATRKPASVAAAPLMERCVIDVSFSSPPGAARRVLNQIAAVNQQFYIVRTLHILNEKDKGPAREGTAAAGGAPSTPASATGAASNTALSFIVGNERLQTSALIEMVRFAF